MGPVPYLELFWAGPVKKVTICFLLKMNHLKKYIFPNPHLALAFVLQSLPLLVLLSLYCPFRLPAIPFLRNFRIKKVVSLSNVYNFVHCDNRIAAYPQQANSLWEHMTSDFSIRNVIRIWLWLTQILVLETNMYFCYQVGSRVSFNLYHHQRPRLLRFNIVWPIKLLSYVREGCKKCPFCSNSLLYRLETSTSTI